MHIVSFHAYHARIIEQISMHLICKLCQAQGKIDYCSFDVRPSNQGFTEIQKI